MEEGVVVLVEGASDQAALEALARRRGRDLAAEGVAIVPIHGAKNIGRFLRQFEGRPVAGLCDAGEAGDFRRGLVRADRGDDLEAAGFFVCTADLEDELIRSLGVEAVEQVIDASGELRALRTLQRQAAQQGRPAEAQLRRFMGSKSGRKLHYARALVDALDLAVPEPLDRLLAHLG